MISKNLPIYIAVFLFPILVATVNHGGSAIYILLLLFGLFLGWPAWQSLESWEKKMLLGFSIFFILISLSFLNTQDFYNGMKKEGRYVLFPLLIPMYLLIKRYQVETGKVYLLGCLVASLVLFGQAWYQTSGAYWYRASGAYNAIIFGDTAMLIVAIVVCALLTVAKNWWHYLLGLVAVVLALSASLMSGSRGAWVLLPVLTVWLLWVKRKSLRPIHLISIAMIFSLSILGSYSITKVKYRVDSAVNNLHFYTQDVKKVNSTQARLELWRDSVTIWKAHPVIGTGIGDFYIDVKQLIDDGLSNSKQAFDHAHNVYFDALAITGIVGLFAVLVFVHVMPYLMFRSFWKKEQDPWIRFYALSGMATIISFAVFGLTADWLARSPFVRTYLMSILVFMSSIAVIKQTKASS